MVSLRHGRYQFNAVYYSFVCRKCACFNRRLVLNKGKRSSAHGKSGYWYEIWSLKRKFFTFRERPTLSSMTRWKQIVAEKELRWDESLACYIPLLVVNVHCECNDLQYSTFKVHCTRAWDKINNPRNGISKCAFSSLRRKGFFRLPIYEQLMSVQVTCRSRGLWNVCYGICWHTVFDDFQDFFSEIVK